jgi:hypothetical protein
MIAYVFYICTVDGLVDYLVIVFGASKLIRLIRMAMTDVKAQVKINAKLTEPFMIRWGLKQGDGLAPLLFNMALECHQKTVSGAKCSSTV